MLRCFLASPSKPKRQKQIILFTFLILFTSIWLWTPDNQDPDSKNDVFLSLSLSPPMPRPSEAPKLLREPEAAPSLASAAKRLKRLRLFEPSLSVLGFFFFAVCVVSGFLYFDSRGFSRASGPGRSERFVWLQTRDSAAEARARREDYLTQSEGVCHVFDGDWVWDEGYPLYESKRCRFVDEGFRCSENGRPDLFYAKWRWQPRDCDLPRFDAKLMLEKLRNKRLVFVGDSIGRNQWESLLCMLSSSEPDEGSIYEVNGNPITKHKGFLVFMFKNYNCTVEYYRSPFLVPQGRPPPRAPAKVKLTLKLDQMDWSASKWRDADIVVFNTGHWWNYAKTLRGGCFFQEGNEVKTDMSVEEAYRRALETVMAWIETELNPTKTQVYFRTYAPVHFRGGDWKNGGNCHMETLPELGPPPVPTQSWDAFRIANGVLSRAPNAKGFGVLNVTELTGRRKDGHSSLYYLGPGVGPASPHRQDCSHWCLPGVPDTWNELLYAFFLKRELSRSPTATS